VLDSVQFDSSSAVYRGRVIADTAKLTIDFALNRMGQGSITTMVLALNDCAPLPDEKAKVRAFAIINNSLGLWVKTADIVIPYSLSDLNGYSEKGLAVAAQDWSSGQWDNWNQIPSSIDTVKHQIVAHMTDFSFVNIYQVYVKSNTGIGPIFANPLRAFGIAANFLKHKHSIAVHFTLPKAACAELRLYDIQGKCVRKCIRAAGAGCSMLQWNLGSLCNGKYFMTIKAGAYDLKEAILIMK
jgi:hypothetical protein